MFLNLEVAVIFKIKKATGAQLMHNISNGKEQSTEVICHRVNPACDWLQQLKAIKSDLV